jgi:nicotinamide phosphoribosyltransferase
MKNIILNTDSYKHSHYIQYPEGTEYVYSYIESRGGEYDKTVFFGLQAFIKEYLMTPITLENIMEAYVVCNAHCIPFNEEGWKHIYYQHNGYLPVEIHAAPEGTVIDTHNVLLTIVNTDPKCFWLTSFLETALLRAIWYPTTVATRSWSIKQIILDYYEQTSDANVSEVDFKLVDFGARGVSSEESAALGGMGHLISFKTTDTLSAILAAKRYYHETMAGFSVPASEHSTITSWGKENEAKAYENMVLRFGDGVAYSVVSDSYDIVNAVENIWGEQLKDLVNSKRARLVVRPDSGDPIMNPIDCILALKQKYGSFKNSKGYHVLPDNIRVLQGDGIGELELEKILFFMKHDRLSAENIVFGMGGGLLQKCDRDTQKFAMKCSAINVNGEWRDVYKEAPGKESKRGRLALIKSAKLAGPRYFTVPHDGNAVEDVLRLVYRNGDLMIDDTFEEIRNRANDKLS